MPVRKYFRVLLLLHCFIFTTASISTMSSNEVCPHQILKNAIENLLCNGSAYACAVEARLSAELLYSNGTNEAYAWGAMALRSDIDIEGKVSWSLPSRPSSWHCSAKTRNGWTVLIFRTGARFIPSTRDHWWWYSTHLQDMCPLSLMRAYFSQAQVKESIEPSDYLKAVMHTLHDIYAGQWAGLTVTKSGRSLLGKAFDLSVPAYLMDSRPAWCQMTATNGWYINVFQLEYSSSDLEQQTISINGENDAVIQHYPSPEIEL